MSGRVVEMPVSAGTLIDRITILDIRRARATDPGTLADATREHALLTARRDAALAPSPALDALTREVAAVNAALWDVEDALRAMERRGDFGGAFVAAARSVYRLNDERAEIKGRIDALTGSALRERKTYRRD